jgi:predicted O-methyltransferase YrrM
MNPIQRVLRYASAWTGLNSLHRESLARAKDSRALIRTTFQYCEGFFAPIQVEDEIVRLADDVRNLNPATVLEIGTCMGGTLYLWTRLAQSNATIISADLPGGTHGGGYSNLRTPLYRTFALPTQNFHLLRVDSHQQSTFDHIQSLLGGKPVDFLFIDGDHTYDGVKADWHMYSPLVRKGGLIAFHDIALSYGDTQVQRLWDEIKDGHEHWEYAYHPQKFYGIGVIRK